MYQALGVVQLHIRPLFSTDNSLYYLFYWLFYVHNMHTSTNATSKFYLHGGLVIIIPVLLIDLP